VELLLYIAGGLVGLRFAVPLIRGRWGRQAGDRWKTESEAHRRGVFQRRREEARKAVDRLIERFFPHPAASACRWSCPPPSVPVMSH
jgi:hypothetical protein